MKISKSKRQLAQLLIEAGVTQFPEGANWAAQDKSGTVCIYAVKPVRDVGDDYWDYKDGKACSMYRYYAESLISNWHQTVLSRDEFDQIVAETSPETSPDADGWIEFEGTERPSGYFNKMIDVKLQDGRVMTDSSGRFEWDTNGPSRIVAYRLHNPELSKSTAVGDDETNLAAKEELEALELAPTPTIDQLLQDWHNADDYAKRKQAEADEAAAMRDDRWQAVQARAGEMGVTVGIIGIDVVDAEFTITDWRDLLFGDIIEYVDGDIKEKNGMTGPVVEFAPEATDGMHVRLRCDNGPNKGSFGWPRKWRFIRRP